MWIGGKDHLADEKDNEYVKSLLPNVEKFEVIEDFSHLSWQVSDSDYFKSIMDFLYDHAK